MFFIVVCWQPSKLDRLKIKLVSRSGKVLCGLHISFLVTALVSIIIGLVTLIPAVTLSDQKSILSGGICDPLIDSPAPCVLPFPSAYYLVKDANTTSGYRVNFPAGALPNTRYHSMDPSHLNMLDGFSTTAPLLFCLSEDIDLNTPGLATSDKIEASLSNFSVTLLIQIKVGGNGVVEVLHF